MSDWRWKPARACRRYRPAFRAPGPARKDHFTEPAFVATAIPGCSGLTEGVAIDQVGNGVQLINVNGAQDFWFTTTAVGAATVVQGTAVFDPVTGNLISFTPDPKAPSYSGQLQQWFGSEANHSNFSNSGTINFRGTSNTGSSFTLHANTHLNTTGLSPTVPNVASAHFDLNCS